ncbi:hypothetical protein FLA_0343 [Filimonas lacunae]|nr:hypothetical protein FLA_0343 [Filimonas lacunae]
MYPPIDTVYTSLTIKVNDTLHLRDMSTGYTMIEVYKGIPETDFAYTIVGLSGMKKEGDVLVSGSGKMDKSGNCSISVYNYNLMKYKDGMLQVVMSLDNDVQLLDTVVKEEYVIRDYQDFESIPVSLSDGYADEVYKQAQDFAFPAIVYTTSPIEGAFKGVYDGRNYKITNLTCASVKREVSGSVDRLGLFSSLDSGSVVKNVRLELGTAGIAMINQGYAGGIAAVANKALISNCSVKGNITDVSNNGLAIAGGIVGKGDNTRIIGSSHTGTIKGTLVAGIAGEAGNTTVGYCYHNGIVDAGTGGGIVGQLTATNGVSGVKIHDSYVFAADLLNEINFSAIYYTGNAAVIAEVTNCFANIGKVQSGATLYTAADELNAQLLEITATDVPEGVTLPADGKPYKAATDATQPMVLWWQ